MTREVNVFVNVYMCLNYVRRQIDTLHITTIR